MCTATSRLAVTVSAMLCGCVGVDLPSSVQSEGGVGVHPQSVAANIVVDGNSEDWVGIQPLIVDASNPNTDIVTVRVASNATDVFFGIEIRNLPVGDGVIVQLDFDPNSTTGCESTWGDIYGTGPTRIGADAVIGAHPYDDPLWPRVQLGAHDAGNPCHFATVGSWSTASRTSSFVEFSVPSEALRRIGFADGFDLIVLSGSDVTTAGAYSTAPPDVPERAADLARTLLGAPYLWGGKGWDYAARHFPDAHVIAALGYQYWNPTLRTMDVGRGLDCSGLVLWSFNKAFGATTFLSGNPIDYENADGQFNYNSAPVSESDLRPGDLLFFDYEPGVPVIDHVALYLGGDAVVEAFTPSTGVILSSKAALKSRAAFRGFRRVSGPQVPLAIQGNSPIDLIVTDPDGLTIDATTILITEREGLRELPGHLYYSEWDRDGDGTMEDRVTSPVLKMGDYVIRVVPETKAPLTATYSLTAEVAGSSIVLARNVMIGSIPAEGYGLSATATGVVKFVPVGMDVMPGSDVNPVNTRAAGRITVAILSTRDFRAPQEIMSASIRFGRSGEEPSIVFCAAGGEDVNADGLLDLVCQASTVRTGFRSGDTIAIMSAQTMAGTPVKARDQVRILP